MHVNDKRIEKLGVEMYEYNTESWAVSVRQLLEFLGMNHAESMA